MPNMRRYLLDFPRVSLTLKAYSANSILETTHDQTREANRQALAATF